ncbi:unnamed protein product [Acanthoscelides obtectus]|uniref:RNA-directed DNA polymerase from mobile element jockey n=1 Tax=Acanthoscelides obtectus TaxID=200917 RepID=A0A9P0MCK5_ACAOB|nr:unnamed protein product [Acanthoscelides obtectus]CAK1661211.1 hypothetical protein AOBTE_LOCUS22515 [Acanthoscelides obtectus]
MKTSGSRIKSNVSRKCKLGEHQDTSQFPEMQDYFSKTYSVENSTVQNSNLSYGVINLFIYEIPISAIYDKLSKLDANKGPGPDGVPPLLIKHCSFLISRPLFYIFNLKLKSGTFPEYWKTSFITPILKSGDPSQVKNDRPISKLSCIGMAAPGPSTMTLGQLADPSPEDHGDSRILNRIKLLASQHLPDGWKNWKVAITERTSLFEDPMDPELINKLRFALPTVGLAQAFIPDCKNLSEKTYREMKVRMLNWPFLCRSGYWSSSLGVSNKGICSSSRASNELSGLTSAIVHLKKRSGSEIGSRFFGGREFINGCF